MSQRYRSLTALASRPLPRWGWIVIPILWAVVCLLLMRPDAIVARHELPDSFRDRINNTFYASEPQPQFNIPFELKWLFYDESDLTAYALRGANIDMGRLPGRRDEPKDFDAYHPEDSLPNRLDREHPPFAERFYLEYPTPTLLLFWLGYAHPLSPDVTVPSVVADSQQFSIGMFLPRTDSERAIWTRLGFAVRFYILAMTAAVIALILVLLRRYGPEFPQPGPVWLVVLPGAMFFSLNRFDVLPALCTALAFACIGRRKLGWAGFYLAIGTMLKLYPVLLLPVIVRYLGWNRSVLMLAVFAGTGIVGAILSVLATDLEGTIGPIQVQLSRQLEEDSWTLYGRLLPMWLAHHGSVRLAILGFVIALMCESKPTDLAGVLRRCGIILFVFVNLAVFWSPQWIVWFLPIIVPLAARSRILTTTGIALDLSNYFTFPILFWILWNTIPIEYARKTSEWMVYIRTFIWVSLMLQFAWPEFGFARKPSLRRAAAQFRANLASLIGDFHQAAAALGSPKELTWERVTPTGEPVFCWDQTDRRWLALQPVEVQFRPVAGSTMEDVPQAQEPRPIVALFAFDGAGWRTDGKAVFNLTPQQIVDRSAGRFQVTTP